MSQDLPLWQPSEARVRNAGITAYMAWLERTRGLRFDSYADLWQWSVRELETFWASLWEFLDVKASQPYTRVLASRTMPGAEWFEGARLNFAEHMLRRARPDQPAIVFESELRPHLEISWARLQAETGALAAYLRAAGVRCGDRVVAYLPNIPESVVGLLAASSLGAVWSSASPDLGHVSVIDRFRQIAPTVLIAVDGYRYGGKDFDRRDVVREIVHALPTVDRVILVPYLDPNARLNAARCVSWSEAVAHPAPLDFAQLPFDHPLWIVYSSGTTGMPKPIVHGHGGVLMEHLKHFVLQLDVHPGDRFFWFSSTNWIMWNLWVGSLLLGCTALQFDGNPGWPTMERLWRFAGDNQATFFGTSAAYIAQCMKSGVEPARIADLGTLTAVGSTGSPLPVEGYRWVYEHVKPDLLLACISGGTDVCTAFVGASPILPIYAGEMQCRGLGFACYAFDDAGRIVEDEVGELVITAPMPSMPIYFWGDKDGARYRESYFETYPGVWRHGDWIRFTPRGTSVIYGRSDSTINRHGIRMGTAELYRVVENVPEIVDSLVVDLEYLGRESFMALFVVLREGVTLDASLKARILDKIRRELSARHVPNDVFAILEVPRTLNGKKLEVPIKKLLLGMSADKVVNRDSMANPDSLAWFIDFAARRG